MIYEEEKITEKFSHLLFQVSGGCLKNVTINVREDLVE